MSEVILIEYKAEVASLRASLTEMQLQLKNLENEAKKSGKGAGAAFNKAGSEINQTLKSIAGAIGITFGIQQVINFGKESIKAFADAEVNANKLRFAITKIGGEGSLAFKKLIDQSAKLQDISIFSDDSIQKAQTQLATLGLNSKQIEELIPKVLDLASATGQDLGSATDSIIQGINGQTRGLKAVGLEFVATGDKTKNLSILTDKLNKFQGSTAAALETTAGKAARLANVYDDLKESVGSYLVDAGNQLLDSFDILSGKTSLAEQASKDVGDVVLRTFQTLNDKRLVIASKAEATRLAQIQATEANINSIAKQGLLQTDVNQKKIYERRLVQEKKFLEDLKTLNNTGKGLGGAVVDPAIAAKQKEEAAKQAKELLETQKDFEDKSIQSSKESFKKKSDSILEEGKRLNKELADADKQSEENALKAQEDAARESLRIEKEKQAAIKAISEQAAQSAITILNSINQLEQQKIDTKLSQINEVHDAEITALDDQLKRNQISQRQYDVQKAASNKKAHEEEIKLKKKAFQLQKQTAIINATISVAEGVAKAFASTGPPYNFILAALVAAAGAAEIAVITNQPTPKFAKGGQVEGRLHSQGGTLIEAERDEWIIKRNESIRNSDLLSAVNKGKGDKYIFENYVEPALKEQLNKYKKQKDSSFASNIANSMLVNSGQFKDGNILDSLKMNRKMDKENIDRLINVLNKNNVNPRKIV